MMFTCKTVDCAMNGEKHAPHPDGIILICGVCLQEMTEIE